MADAAIKFATSQVGKPYVWGASGPDAYDCSGLVYAAYKHAGYKFPAGRPWTGTLITYGTNVSRNELAPGDLVFPDPGHVQIYIGGGKVVEAVEPGIPLRVHAMWGFWRARRLVPPGTPYQANNGGKSLNPLSGLNDAFSFLSVFTDPHFWFRLGLGILGVVFMVMALTSKQAPTAVKATVNATRKVVNT